MTTRRDFLDKMKITALGLPLLYHSNPLLAHETPYQGPVLRVALMGLGSYANRVAEAMRECKMAKVTGLISGTPTKIPKWQKAHNIPDKNCYNYENFDAIKDNPDDVVHLG
ncbi:MAG: hypothetical protein RID25_02160 [Cyclobacteriaceae bacterium]